MLEAIITDVRADARHDKAAIYLRNIGTLHVPLEEHLFTSRDITTPELVGEKRAEIALHPMLKEAQTAVFLKGAGDSFNTIHVKGKPSLGEHLNYPEGKAPGKKKRTAFTTKDYVWTAREHYGMQGSIATLDDTLADAIMTVREHNQTLRTLKARLATLLPDHNPRYQTTAFNKLTEELSQGTPIEMIITKGYINKLPRAFIDERTQHHERYHHLITNDAFSITVSDKPATQGELSITLKDRSLFTKGRPMTFEEFNKQKKAYLDIEIPLFRTDKPEISWVEVHYEDEQGVYKQELHTLNDFGIPAHNGRTIHGYKDEATLVTGVTHALRAEHPYVVLAYNTNFDLTKLREVKSFLTTDELFTPDEEDRSRVVKTVNTKFFEQLDIKTRMVVDLLRVAQIQYDFLPNKKLDLVSKVILGVDAFAKSHTYDELADAEMLFLRLRRLMENPAMLSLIPENKFQSMYEETIDQFLGVAGYIGEDVAITPRMLASQPIQNVVKRMTWISSIIDVPLEKLLYSQQGVLKEFERAYTKKHHVSYEQHFLSSKKARDDYAKDKQSFKNWLGASQKISATPGIYKDVHLLYYNYAKALKDYLVHLMPRTKPIFDEQATSKEDHHLLTRIMNALAEPLIAEHTHIVRLQQRYDRVKTLFDKEDYHTFYLSARNQFTFADLRKKTFTKTYLDHHLPDEVKTLITDNQFTLSDLHFRLVGDHKIANKKFRFHKNFGKIPLSERNSYQTNDRLINQTFDDITRRLAKLPTTATSLATKGLEPIHAQGPYLYVKGDPSSIDPHLITHSFDQVLITRDVHQTKTKGYQPGKQHLIYNLFGFYKGITVKNTPSTHMNMLTMRQFNDFFTAYAGGDARQALEQLHTYHQLFTNEQATLEDLIFHSKASKRSAIYEQAGPVDEQGRRKKTYFRDQFPKENAHEQGEATIYKRQEPFDLFYPHYILKKRTEAIKKPLKDLTKEEIQEFVEQKKLLKLTISFDQERHLYYYQETINNHKERIYISPLAGFTPDWNAYTKDNQDRVLNVLHELIGPLARTILTNPTSRDYEQGAKLLEARIHE